MRDALNISIPNILQETDLSNNAYDGILVVVPPIKPLKAASQLESAIRCALTYDPSLETEIAVLPLQNLPAGRLVYAPTGPLDPDYDDVRSLKETAVKGLKRALKVGIRKLLTVLEEYPNFENSELVTLLGILEALYKPIQAREADPSKTTKLDLLGIYTSDKDKTKQVIGLAIALESGRYIARDIGGADPERMTPIKIQRYLEEVFSKSSIKISVIDDPKVFAEEYPLFEAVNRAASVVERHRGRIVFLEYNPPEKVEETLLLVGKGVTYDTGGADIKAGGVMISMSRDKCGAAAVVGFLQIVSELKPKHVKVIGVIGLVRNSVGSNCYVSDEIIMSRCKAMIRIGNTDAEGRMVMADLLCRMKEIAINSINPHLFTIATLTGHARLTVGDGYSILMNNGPAHNAGFGEKLQKRGQEYGEPIEISTLRREDFAFHRGKTEGEDIFQSSPGPSTRTRRGHQGPAAFLILASGLDKHGSGSEKPIKYSHFDITGSAGIFPFPATGAPIVALASTLLLN
ncbi:hypothetical protein ILUMI_26473 [Ignelater luminosus]|uniref:Cytosol aminopeptidase domain-containing protein n=1 Tax=Ignelater luminosus TaxID=2038154 RepID=A0A8K0C8E4_IGNLU|nr:hypothetical protein ILUMI_26473 [Ignelater luminosus]